MLKGLDGTIDLIVPRGGKSLVARVQDEARVPVLAHLEGVCHVYVHAKADLAMARAIVLNAKMRRTGVCGAAETLLIDRAVLESHGVLILNDVRHTFEKNGTIFIPKNSWHGFANPDHELLLLWIVSPAGLDGLFRETCNPPGVPPKHFTHDQINEIARKYATEFR